MLRPGVYRLDNGDRVTLARTDNDGYHIYNTTKRTHTFISNEQAEGLAIKKETK